MKVNCNNCGHILEINPDTAFVTCLRCEANLLVVRTDNAVYTKINDQAPTIPAPLLEQPDSNPTQSATAEIYAAIQLLDNEWEHRLPTFMTKGSLPSDSVTAENAPYLIIFFMIILSCIIIVLSLIKNNIGDIFKMLFILAISIISSVMVISNRNSYFSAKKEYESRRAALVSKLPKI